MSTPKKAITKMKRRWLMILGLAFSFLTGYSYRISVTPNVQEASNLQGIDLMAVDSSLPPLPTELIKPSVSLSPGQVVAIQMEAMADYQQNRSQIHQVFAHASPSNRAVTGPIANFERMLLGAKYRALIFNNHYQIGRAVEKENFATVLATTVDMQGRVSVYRFFLSKQMVENEGCWMTDGVFQIVSNWRPGEGAPAMSDPLPVSV